MPTLYTVLARVGRDYIPEVSDVGRDIHDDYLATGHVYHTIQQPTKSSFWSPSLLLDNVLESNFNLSRKTI